MDKKVGVVIFSVFALIGLFLVAGYYTGLGFYGGSWGDFNSQWGNSYTYTAQPYFGDNSIASFYYSYAGFIDFILYLTFFLILAHVGLGKVFDSGPAKKLSVVIGVMLALALTVLESRSGTNLLNFLGTYVIIFVAIIVIALIIFATRRFHGGGILGISVAYLLFYFYVLRDTRGYFSGGVFYELIYYNYFLAKVLDFLVFLAWVGIIWGIVMMVKGRRGGEG